MTGDQFLVALSAAIAPATITAKKNNTADRNGGMDLTLSDGRSLTVLRQKIKDARSEVELNAYVQSFIG